MNKQDAFIFNQAAAILADPDDHTESIIALARRVLVAHHNRSYKMALERYQNASPGKKQQRLVELNQITTKGLIDLFPPSREQGWEYTNGSY